MDHDSPTYARTRAIGALCAMVVGIWVATSMIELDSMAWFALACGLVSVSIVLPVLISTRLAAWTRSVFMLLAISAMSAGWLQLRVVQTPSDRLDAIVANQVGEQRAMNQRVPIHVQGTILDHVQTAYRTRQAGDPPMWSMQSTRTRMQVDRVYFVDEQGLGSWISASGIARVLLPSATTQADHPSTVRAGDHVEMVALYSSSGGARNLGDPDYRSMSAQSNQVGTLIVADESMIRVLVSTSLMSRARSAYLQLRGEIRDRALNAIGAHETGSSDIQREQRGMLSALLLGQRDPSFGDVYESFQRVGVSHVLAISGFHLALVIFLGVFAIRALGEHPRTETTIIVLILVLGVILIPMRPPVVRAGCIVLSLMIASLIGRKYDRLTILAWVGCGLLIWRPLDAFSLGYQLSMGITALLILLADQSRHYALDGLSITTPTGSNHNGSIWPKSTRKLGAIMRMNIACWLVAMPTIMYHAGIVSVLAPLVSIVLIPMVMVLMLVGYIQIAIGVVAPDVAMHTMVMTDALAQLVRWFVVEVDQWDGSSFGITNPPALWALCATLVITLLVTKRWKIKRTLTMSSLGVLGIWLAMSAYAWNDQALLRIDMVDVGDGSCVLVGSGSDGILWDSGSLDRRVADTVIQVIHKRKLRVRDVVVTHDNIDHYNAIPELVEPLGIERVWITKRMIDHPSTTWIECAQLLIDFGVEIKELAINQQLTIGSATIDCLWPDPTKIDGLSDNDTSAVVMVRVQTQDDEQPTRSILLCGDIEGPAINGLLGADLPLHADIMELPHHGSAKADAIEFVSTINPSVVLQSTGPSRLNDPRWDLVRNDRVWYATAQQGGAWVQISNDGTITHGWAINDARNRNN